MARGRTTKGIDRQQLARVCLDEIRLWPGCESVVSVGVLAVPADCFMLRVIEYGAADIKLADRALRAIERVKRREYHLNAG